MGSPGLVAISRSRLIPSLPPSDRSSTTTSYGCSLIWLLASSSEVALSAANPSADIARVHDEALNRFVIDHQETTGGIQLRIQVSSGECWQWFWFAREYDRGT